MQTTEQQAEFKNEAVSVSVKRKAACMVEFDVQATPKLVQKAKRDAIKSVAKEVTLPGFRKGKAPDELVTKKHPESVDKKWQEVIAHVAFQESEQLVRIPVLTKETKIVFKMHSHSDDQGAALTLSFETEPEVPAIDPTTVQLKEVKRPEVNEEKVDETIRQTQLFFASWTHIQDRPAQANDFVLLDVIVLEDHSKLFADTRFEITDKSMAEWMKNLVVGLKTGESAEGISKPDDDLSEKEKEAYKDKKVKVVLKAIESADIPVLDDEFAKKLGVENVADLKVQITGLLNKQADEHVKEHLREQVGDALLEQYAFDLPKSLVDKEANFRLRQLLQDPQFQKHWDAITNEERQKIVLSLIEQSKKAVQMFYLCRKIISDAKLTITAKDLHKAASSPLEALLLPQPYISQNQPDLQQAEAVSRILLEKAEDHIIAHAQKTSDE